MSAVQSAPLRTMIARVSIDDVIIYANDALAAYLKTPKRHLIGSSLEEVWRLCRGEISECFARPQSGRTSNRLVSDADGKVFEAQVYASGGTLDIVLDEIGSPSHATSELRESSGTPLELLSEEELRTVRHPERRYLSITYTRLRGLPQLALRLDPMEMKLIIDSFVEEASESVRNTGGTVGETACDTVLGICGAPRYYSDHPLRAVLAACEQIQRASQLHAGLYREGKELPPCSCGIWTGDALVGVFGTSIWQRYTAIGAPLDLAARLSDLARPGEAILPEHTLTHLLRTLPEGWQHIRAESEHEPDSSDIDWSEMEISPVPEHLRKVVYLVGRGVQEDPNRTELYFDYLWSFRVPGRDQPTPVLRVVRPALVSDSFELSENNVVTTQATQALGKYKLIEVIGTGGMGTVWRGIDRFGNTLAIKILHSSQTVTDGQLKRFRREAEIMARLPHRNICRVYELNEFDGIEYIAMEFVDGIPLSDLLYEKASSERSSGTEGESELRELIRSVRSARSASNENPNGADPSPRATETRILPIEQTLSLILKVCDAIQFAHEHGVLHRDLKPGNILLREDGEPLVADFGLAKLKSSEGSRSLSLTGHVVGTLENMAPEQAESSKDVDERADVYSIGTILYQMLSGRRHFEATGNIVNDGQALKTHEPARPRTFNPQIHPDLEIITLKALRNEPADRYRNVAAFRADIDHYRRGELISAKPVSPLDLLKKLVVRNKVVSGVIGASVFVIVAGAGLAIYFLNARLKAAHDQYVLAEQQLEAATRKEQEARLAAEEARSQQTRAEQALAEMQRAESATRDAQAPTEKALVETQAECHREDKGELGGALHEEELEQQIADVQAAQGAPAIPVAAVSSESSPELPAEAKLAMSEALRIYDLELSPDELDKFERTPGKIVDRVTEALNSVSRALVVQPNMVAAWMLKGRLHWALMEFDRAADSFRQVVNLDQPPSEIEGAVEALELATTMANGGSEKYLKGAEALLASPLVQNVTAGGILEFFNRKPSLRHASNKAPGPLRQKFTANEVALELIRRNGTGLQAYIDTERLGRTDVIIWGAEEVNDLSPLRDIDVSGLAVIGASSIDWQTIFSLPLDSLDFSKSRIEGLPQNPRGFLRVRSVTLAFSDVTNVDFAWGMPLLNKLDLSFTQITDLTPLGVCRRLQHLDLAGLNPTNLRTLRKLPLESLTLSPMLMSDKNSLNALRLHRTLKILRSPQDPPDQPASEFWRKLDSGQYSQIY
jgi:serine/threonine protein kinase/class 3 adenylate cyclase/tetratricopeptide (TPR) repeat protein